MAFVGQDSQSGSAVVGSEAVAFGTLALAVVLLAVAAAVAAVVVAAVAAVVPLSDAACVVTVVDDACFVLELAVVGRGPVEPAGKQYPTHGSRCCGCYCPKQ